MLSTVLLLAACHGGGIEIDETDSIDTNGTDTDDTDGTGLDTTTTFDFGGHLMVPADVTVPAGSIEVVLVEGIPGATASLHTIWQRAPILAMVSAGGSFAWQFHLPLVPEDAEFTVPNPDHPEMEAAGWLVGAWIDENGDDALDPDDSYVGASSTWLFYLRGTLSPDAAAEGAEIGWNLVQYDFANQADPLVAIVPLADDDLTFNFDANFLPHPGDDLPMLIRPDLGGDVAVGLYSAIGFDGGDVPADPTLSSIAVTSDAPNIAAVLPGPLPAPPSDQRSSLFDGGDNGIDYGLYIGIAWVDSNPDGNWDRSEREPAVANSNASGTDGRIVWWSRVHSFQAVWLVSYGWQTGWMLWDSDESGHPGPRDWEQGLVLDNQG